MESISTTQEYTAPVIVDYGAVTDLTAGGGSSGRQDQTFPVGTDTSHFTFS